MEKEMVLDIASALGANGVLEKPFTVEGVLEVVNDALKGEEPDGYS
jgi:hypothetical protein